MIMNTIIIMITINDNINDNINIIIKLLYYNILYYKFLL